MSEYALYFDRKNNGTIYGSLTLQESIGGQAKKIFDRIRVASGQSGYTNGGDQDWVTGKGPTPYGMHWLSTKSEMLQESPIGTRFYVISTVKGARSIDKGRNNLRRINCGLHLDNLFPGSAGCIAIPNYTVGNKLFDYLDGLYIQGIQYIKLVVL